METTSKWGKQAFFHHDAMPLVFALSVMNIGMFFVMVALLAQRFIAEPPGVFLFPAAIGFSTTGFLLIGVPVCLAFVLTVFRISRWYRFADMLKSVCLSCKDKHPHYRISHWQPPRVSLKSEPYCLR